MLWLYRRRKWKSQQRAHSPEGCEPYPGYLRVLLAKSSKPRASKSSSCSTGATNLIRHSKYSSFRKTVVVPAYEDSKKYMDKKPTQAVRACLGGYIVPHGPTS